MKKKCILILDNIRSVHNVGSLFRTADGIGIESIFLSGTTPSPIDRFGRKRNDFAKVSLGAEETVSWEYFETTLEAIKHAQQAGCQIVALEQNEESLDLDEFTPSSEVALVLGTEVTGISTEILNMCDIIVEIPMQGKKESFNVSIAGAIAMYEIMKKM